MSIDDLSRGALHSGPESDDVRVCGPPCVNQRLHFFLRHLRAHVLQRADSAAITVAQCCLLPFLPVFVVRVPFDDGFLGYVKHAGGCGLVDFSLASEFLQHPFLAGQPGQHTRLNGGEVGHQKAAAVLRDQRRADQFRQRVGYGAVEHFHQLRVTLLDHFLRFIQVGKVILGDVLKLDKTSSPAARPRCAVKLRDTVDSAILAHGARHGLVFLDGGL